MDLFNDDKKKKKGSGFTIISGDSTSGHKGFGQGVLSLNNISPVIVDLAEKEAYVDMGAMHARSEVEKRIKFSPNRDEVPNGKLYWLVWVTIEHIEGGPAYVGVTGCEMVIDAESRRGYKSLPEHVNNMDKALKRRIIVDKMDQESKTILGNFLKNFDQDIWNRSSVELKEQLLGE
ncbi:YwhD family protein [Anaerobacillus sp. MEB173]|uniref:YwhD family protein n=1 Tax=Anaerobacillus sp. MEB173 TaxID=3383345 RepID=UPI003F935D11